VSSHRPPVIFIRHGETEWNRQGLIQGRTDIPLNDRGHAQARALAAALAAVPGVSQEFDFVVSPLLRARQTMGYLAEALQLEAGRVGIDAAIRELGFGVWEGKPFQDLKASPAFPAHPEGRYAWQPEGGESYEDGHARMRGWLGTLDGPTVVVAHGAIGRCLVGEHAGLLPHELVSIEMRQGYYCRLANGRADWFDAGSDAF